MNVLEEVIIKSPNNIDEKCGKFTIDDVTDPFILSSITRSGEHYIFSAWIKSSVAGTVSIYGEKINTTTEWSKYEIGFSSNGTGVNILFEVSATYYFYHSKLEIGNKATDWTPAPEDMVDKDNIISCINQTPESITIQANKISLEGLITANSNFKILQDGSMETIAGKIGGWAIGNNKIYSSNPYSISDKNGTSYVSLVSDNSNNNEVISIVYDYLQGNTDKTEGSTYVKIFNDGRLKLGQEGIWADDAPAVQTTEIVGDQIRLIGSSQENFSCTIGSQDIEFTSSVADSFSVRELYEKLQFKTNIQTVTTDKYGQASLKRPSDFSFALCIHSESYEYGVFWVNGLNIRAYDISSSKSPTRADNVSFKVSLNYVIK